MANSLVVNIRDFGVVPDHVAAIGTIQCVSYANLASGDRFTIPDDSGTTIFEYNRNGAGIAANRVPIAVIPGMTAQDVAVVTAAAINTVFPLNNHHVEAKAGSSGLINLTSHSIGTAGNVTITENVVNAGFIVSGMSGGLNGTAGATNLANLTTAIAAAQSAGTALIVPRGDYLFLAPIDTIALSIAGSLNIIGEGGSENTHWRFGLTGGSPDVHPGNPHTITFLRFVGKDAAVKIKGIWMSGPTSGLANYVYPSTINIGLYFSTQQNMSIGMDDVRVTDFGSTGIYFDGSLGNFDAHLHDTVVQTPLIGVYCAENTAGVAIPSVVVTGKSLFENPSSRLDPITGQGHCFYTSLGVSTRFTGTVFGGTTYHIGYNFHENAGTGTPLFRDFTDCIFAGPYVGGALVGTTRKGRFINCHFLVPPSYLGQATTGVNARNFGASFTNCTFEGLLTPAGLGLAGASQGVAPLSGSPFTPPFEFINCQWLGTWAVAGAQNQYTTTKDWLFSACRFDQQGRAILSSGGATDARITLDGCILGATNTTVEHVAMQSGTLVVQGCIGEQGITRGVLMSTSDGAGTVRWINNASSIPFTLTEVGHAAILNRIARNGVAISGSGTVALDAYLASDQVLFSGLTGAVTMTLPRASHVQAGTRFSFIDLDGSVGPHPVTVGRNATVPDTINGSATDFTINTAYSVINFCSDGISNWTLEVVSPALSLATIGSSPNTSGASVSNQVLTLQPADATHGGILTTGTQTFGGAKTFASLTTNGGGTELSVGANASIAGTLTLSNAAGGNALTMKSGAAFVLNSDTGGQTYIYDDSTNHNMGFHANVASAAATNGAYYFDTQNTLAGASDLLVSFANHGTSKASIDKNGNATLVGKLTSGGLNCTSGTINVTGASGYQLDGASFVVHLGNGLQISAPGNSSTGATFYFYPGTNNVTSGNLFQIAASNTGNPIVASIDYTGKVTAVGGLSLPYSDQTAANAGAGGNATANTPTGRAAIASGASSCVITNSFVSATSIVDLQLESTGVGIDSLAVSAGSGSFTVTSLSGLGITTVTGAKTQFSWIICN